MNLNDFISDHDIFCIVVSLVVCCTAVGFVTIIGYFWDTAYKKGYEDAIEDM